MIGRDHANGLDSLWELWEAVEEMYLVISSIRNVVLAVMCKDGKPLCLYTPCILRWTAELSFWLSRCMFSFVYRI